MQIDLVLGQNKKQFHNQSKLFCAPLNYSYDVFLIRGYESLEGTYMTIYPIVHDKHKMQLQRPKKSPNEMDFFSAH